MKHSTLLAVCTLAALYGAPIAAADVEGFTSPSGNIGCITEPGYVRCDIDERDWTPPPRPADCSQMTGYGQGIMLHTHGQPAFVCGGDTALGMGSALPYGQTHVGGGLSCNSEPTGMRCSNSDGHGFTIAQEAYSLF